ncbi:nSTAND1 domain-containing NTPase [Nostoc sp.]|uniref:nSTAND1 domain-containing NTPase n=1 Tax=Nostoc sp. TaxID=1180 RepID=UPI003FA60C0F
MTDSQPPENDYVNSERYDGLRRNSVTQLAWAIESSVGQFKLILARCNYARERDRLISKLQEICQVEIRVLAVQQSHRTLYTAIQSEFGEEKPACVMVVGLESVQNLSVMLTSANQVREEFRKNFPFPLVLWINDEIYKQLIQFAPDLESWATTRNFAIATVELIDFLQQTAAHFFNNHLNINLEICPEIKSAWQDLQSSGQILEGELKANCLFLLGLVENFHKNLDSAIEYYHQSLVFWRSTNNLERQGERLRHITISYYDKARKSQFFFVYTEPAQRKQFFEFLGECLNVLSVKVILSLRVDYIHYLLECNDLPSLKIIGNDILSNNVLYKLGNFSPADAKLIIQRLTENANFHLEPALVEEMVLDLAGELGEVRPIELQVVGAQLQTENITTLAEYQQRGTKDELVKRYLDEVVNDCGEENHQAADILLYLLTDDKGTRPLKTRAELERDLIPYLSQIPPTPLKKGGLVSLTPFLRGSPQAGGSKTPFLRRSPQAGGSEARAE